MNYKVWKYGIFALCGVFLHCDNSPLQITKIHPILILKSEVGDSTTSVVITTSFSKKYQQSRIVNDTCYLTYPQQVEIDGQIVIVTDSVVVLNNPDTLKNGRFFGSWAVPESILVYGSLIVSGTVMDEEGHEVVGSIFLDQNLPFPEKKCTITTSAGSNGSIALDPAGGTYVSGTEVTVTATPNTGYVFSGWSGNLSGSTNPTTITMNSNKSVTANFSATVNLLTNGDFSNGMTGWVVAATSPSTAAGSVVSGQLYVNITSDNGTLENISLKQIGISLKIGTSYTVSFDARAQSSRTISVQVRDWAGSGVISQNKTLSTTMSNYSMTFSNTKATSPNYKLFFLFGGAGVKDVWLDNIKFRSN